MSVAIVCMVNHTAVKLMRDDAHLASSSSSIEANLTTTSGDWQRNLSHEAIEQTRSSCTDNLVTASNHSVIAVRNSQRCRLSSWCWQNGQCGNCREVEGVQPRPPVHVYRLSFLSENFNFQSLYKIQTLRHLTPHPNPTCFRLILTLRMAMYHGVTVSIISDFILSLNPTFLAADVFLLHSKGRLSVWPWQVWALRKRWQVYDSVTMGAHRKSPPGYSRNLSPTTYDYRKLLPNGARYNGGLYRQPMGIYQYHRPTQQYHRRRLGAPLPQKGSSKKLNSIHAAKS